jgi:hypothetical protein
MAGRGPAPKPSDRRARRNADPVPSRVIENWQSERKTLPDDLLNDGEEWHPATVRWWLRWLESPLSATWTEVDWSELEACALLHHEFMKRRTFTLAGEIRLRVAKFGATPEDRARLRIVFADADEKDSKRPETPTSRDRFAGLKAV